MTAWTDYVKKFAKDNNMTYGCALSDPACSSGYRNKQPPKRKKLSQGVERELMGFEEDDTKKYNKQLKHRKQVEKLKSILDKKVLDKEVSFMAKEDINRFVPVQDLAGNIINIPKKKKSGRRKKGEENITMTIKEVKKRGRPKKYATAEEARKAKIANTIASAKKRKVAQGKGIKVGGLVGKAITPQEAYALYRDYLNTFNNNPTQETINSLKTRWDNVDFGNRDISEWRNSWSAQIIGELFQKLYGDEVGDMEMNLGGTLPILPINSFRIDGDDDSGASSGESEEGAGLLSKVAQGKGMIRGGTIPKKPRKRKTREEKREVQKAYDTRRLTDPQRRIKKRIDNFVSSRIKIEKKRRQENNETPMTEDEETEMRKNIRERRTRELLPTSPNRELLTINPNIFDDEGGDEFLIPNEFLGDMGEDDLELLDDYNEGAGMLRGGRLIKTLSPRDAYAIFRDYMTFYNASPTDVRINLLQERFVREFSGRTPSDWTNDWTRNIIGALYTNLYRIMDGAIIPIPPITAFRPIQYSEEYDDNTSYESELTGNGIFNTIYNLGNLDTIKKVIQGRNDFSPKVYKIINQFSNKVITGITLHRTPLNKSIMTALQVASGNTFSQKLSNTPYDTLFHLFMCINFQGKSFVLEKNEVINAENSCKISSVTESKTITNIPTGLTLKQALDKTQKSMGNKFFTYSAKDNNCQDFIVSFLTANNIGSSNDIVWVKQDTKSLFEGNDTLRKITNTITDIGARVDVLRQGAGIIDFEDMKWGSFSKQLKAYNSQYNKKLDLHNFAMMILANPDKFKDRTKKRARFYINVILKKGGMIDEENDPLFQNPLPIVANPPPPPPPPPEPEPVNIPTPVATKKNDKIKDKIKGGKIKSPNNNIGMANSWINHVKNFAKKHNIKYNEALKHPDCKSSYKKGMGIPTQDDELIAIKYDQRNLGANGKVNLN